MTYKNALQALWLLLLAASCTTPNPNRRQPPADASADGAADAPGDGPPLCTANQPLRCEAGSLVRCNGNGTAELKESCPLGCVASDLRCTELVPSNGLAKYFAVASGQPDLDLGDSATINTDTGEVKVFSVPVAVYSDTVAQPGPPGTPAIRVFAVRSLRGNGVTVRGRGAFAVVASGGIVIDGVFSVSGYGASGPGAFNDVGCRGQNSLGEGGGAGGGGFGSKGSAGAIGFAQSGGAHFTLGAAGGSPSGEPTLVPLRGGCDGGSSNGNGGGAMQLVSRTEILILGNGRVAANGEGGYSGGGAGGGILLEAPTVTISGNVVANGGGGGNGIICGAGHAGLLDARPAPGSPFCRTPGNSPLVFGPGGSGGAGSDPPHDAEGGFYDYGGHGGGGYGRIRINTASGDFSATGVVSPSATKGTIVTR